MTHKMSINHKKSLHQSIILIIALSLLSAACNNVQPQNQPVGGADTGLRNTPTNTTTPSPIPTQIQAFNSSRALENVAFQVALGPRIPGSEAHDKLVDWIQSELSQAGWDSEMQATSMMNQPIRNIIGRWGKGRPWIILGAHYDSRIVADRDPNPENQLKPVLGANDGASGVAVLLELARILPDYAKELRAGQIWLVFFDAEDNGNIPGYDWILGSRAFVDSLTDYPDSVVIVDMVGDINQEIYQEANSDPKLTSEIWAKAAELGYSDRFIVQPGNSIIDDHLPFIQLGIPAVDIIDINYPHWHTADDTLDKISALSLKVVGDTLLTWLTNKSGK